MIKFKRGYRMYDCSIEEFNAYETECYEFKVPPTPDKKFKYMVFDKVEQAVELLRMTFIPRQHSFSNNHTWSLHENKQEVILDLVFDNYNESYLYQCAVERAWALSGPRGGHLDKRVEQIYYE